MTAFTFQTVRSIECANAQTEFISGFNGDVDSGSVPEDIWPQGGLIAFPSAEAVVSVVSDNANDAAVGTGARMVMLTGVNDAFDVVTEIVTLNGLTPVLTATAFLFVNDAVVITVGSTNANEGLITFTISGNLCNVIDIGKNITQAAAQIFPNPMVVDTTPHLIAFFASVGRAAGALATIEVVLRPAATGIDLFSLDIPLIASSPFDFDIKIPVAFAAGDRLTARVSESSANNVLAAAIFQFVWLNPQT